MSDEKLKPSYAAKIQMIQELMFYDAEILDENNEVIGRVKMPTDLLKEEDILKILEDLK